MKKRILAFCLTMMMLVSMLPMTAFAADGVTLTVGGTSVESGAEFVLPVTISNNSGITNFNITVTGITEGLTLTKVSAYPTAEDESNEENGGICASGTFTNNENVITWVKTSASIANKDLFYLYFTANSAGSYTIGLEQTENTANFVGNDGTAVSTSVVAGTVTVTAPVSNDPYTAALSSTTTTVDNDGTSTVSVDVVVGGTTGSFASTEIKLAYDPTYLTFNANSSSCKLTAIVPEGKTDQEVSISAKNGVITIRDYGGTMNVDTNGTTAYTLEFYTVEGGNTDVSLTSAGFSTQGDAASNDLTYVTDTDSGVSVTINHKATVTVDGTAGTPTYVAPNGSYTYQISDYNETKYSYSVTATEDGDTVDASRISIDSTGKVTITGVSGELAVTVTATPKSYNITWTDTQSAITTTNKPNTQTYGTGITFEVKAGQAPNGTADGYYYSVRAYLTDNTNTAVTVSSTETDNYAAKTYTIAADAITGDITIEVTKVDVSANQTTITISGDYSELSKDDAALTSGTLNVDKNAQITLTLNKEDGYTYAVQTKVGDADAQDVTVDENGSFTISVGDDALTLIITKTLNTTSLDVTQYVQLDDKTMWLVTVKTTQINGKTYRYSGTDNVNGEKFYWSTKYNSGNGAYCFLVVEDANTPKDTVKSYIASKLTLVDGTATTISYDGNVNLTFKNQVAVIDVNDVQLVWNMYSAVYNGFDTDVTVQKFLEADMDNSGALNTVDAVAVVDKIQ